MFSLRICRPALSLSALLWTSVSAQRNPLFTSLLPTGVRLDPAGEAVDLGSLPINLVLTPEKDRAVVVLSGWREQGLQVVDLRTRKVTQTLLQDGAFYGAAFWPDGHHLCVTGDNTDKLFVYAWKDGAATLENNFELAKAKNGGRHGHKLSGGPGVLAQRKIHLCRGGCRRSARGGQRRDRRDHATVFHRSLSLWRRAHWISPYVFGLTLHTIDVAALETQGE